MSIYQKLNDITSRVVTLEQGASSAVITATTASNFQVTNQLSGGTILASTLTASSFSASTGLANLTTLTASNFSASAGLANLTTLTASNFNSVNTFITTLQANNFNAVTNFSVAGLSYEPMDDNFYLDNNTIFYLQAGSKINSTSEIEANGGITFNEGDSILSSYEEGTWTPQYKGATTAGTFVYNFNNGYYTKIGRHVFFQGTLKITSTSVSPVGDMQITGLPFTIANESFNYPTCIGGVFSNFSASLSTTSLRLEGQQNSIYLKIYKAVTSGSSQNTRLQGSDLASSDNTFSFSGFYFTS